MKTKEESAISKTDSLLNELADIQSLYYSEIEGLVERATILIHNYFESENEKITRLKKIKFSATTALANGYAWIKGKAEVKSILEAFKYEVQEHLDKKQIALEMVSEGKSFWLNIHPEVTNVSKKLFEGGNYKEAVFAATLELNDYIKNKGGNRIPKNLDGTELMQMVFGKPVLSMDDSSQSGKNIHEGYKKIFEGTVQAIRNPKAHGNFQITEQRGVHLIFLCSLLFYKIDDAKIV